MKKIFIIIFIFTMPYTLIAQPESIKQADFSSAKMSIAGPDKIYLRDVRYEGEEYSLTLQALDEMGNEWQVTDLYPESNNYAPENMLLDFVDITPTDDDTLDFSGIIWNGSSYSASFTIDQSGKLTLNEPLHESAVPDNFITKLGSFKDLLLELEKDKYEKKISQLMEESDRLNETIDSLKRENNSQSDRISELNKKAKALEQDKDELKKQVDTLEQQMKNRQQASSQALSGEGTGPSIPAKTAYTFSKSLLKGFARSVPQLGNWSVTESTATQRDPGQYFAKLVLPIAQEAKPTLYEFSTRSRGNGWVGTGMHIFATDKLKKKGYGFGNSILVWLTRDRDYYGTDDTRLQIYRSDDAVQMEMVLDAIIKDPITHFLDVEILYEPVKEYITISVNGIEKLRYKTWFSIDSGSEIALRSLGGGADFKDLRVMTEE